MDKLIPIERVEKKIYFIRGEKVMLDKDLAGLYEVKPIKLREQVKRNLKRFPNDFMFQLTKEEADLMVSQNAIPSRSHFGGHLPLVFTEHGALMLSSVLKSKKAAEMGIFIVRAFVKIRELLSSQSKLAQKVEQLERKYDLQFKVVYDTIKRLMKEEEKPKKKIGFLADRE